MGMERKNYYEFFKIMGADGRIKKLVDKFFEKHEKEILKDWLNNYVFCREEDYVTAQCDEYIVSSEVARGITQPLYDFVERVEKEIACRLFNLFITTYPSCSNCKYFKRKEGMSHDEGWCVLHNEPRSDGDLCDKYEANM